MLESPPFDVAAVLTPVRRRLGMVRAGTWCLRGLGIGACLGIAFLLVDRVWAVPQAVPVSLALTVAGALLGFLVGAGQWPDLRQAARLADRYFQLHDRLTTSLEFRASADPIPGLQRQDTARRVRQLPLGESVRGEVRPREAFLIALFAGMLVALLLIPSSPAITTSDASSRGDRQRIQQAASEALPLISHTLVHGLTPQEYRSTTLRQALHVLSQLQHQLRNASSRPVALRAVSSAQQQLQQLSASLRTGDGRSVAAMMRSLRSFMTAGERAQALSGRQVVALDEALNRLAQRSLRAVSQRARLSRALQQASSTVGNREMQTLLRQAASAVATNDSQTAAGALRRASADLLRAGRDQNYRTRLKNTSAQLDLMKNDVSGVERGQQSRVAQANAPQDPLVRSSSSTGSAGARRVSRQAQGEGQGTGAQHGQGSGGRSVAGFRAGAGQGTNRGSGHPRSAGPGTGVGGLGGQGGGGSKGGAGPNGRGAYVTVYVPGKQGKGLHTLQTSAQVAPANPGQLVPYQRVVLGYSRAAHAALEHGVLPPSLQTYVRRYFSEVSH